MTVKQRGALVLLVGLVVLVALGAAAVVAGESDDSPGLQGIGVIVAGLALWRIVAVLRRRA